MKTQQISIKDLKELYDVSCNDWQIIIKDLLIWNTKEVIDIDEKLILKAYSEANPSQILIKKNNLWWLIDGSMYIYYTLTHYFDK